MKFSKGDVVQRALPNGLMVGGLMIVIARARSKCTAVRDVSTGKCYIYNSSSLGMVGKTTKVMISESDMNKINVMKALVHSIISYHLHMINCILIQQNLYVLYQSKRTVLYVEHFILGKYLEYFEKLTKFVKGTKWFQLSNQCTSYN